MSLSIRMKSLVANACCALGVAKVSSRIRRNGSFPILMYHRVIPNGESLNGVQPGMYVEKSNFEKQVTFLLQQFRVVPLAEAHPGFRREQGKAESRIPCILTFDDGWADFYRHAFPVLRKYGVPATVFLPTNYIGSNERFWTEIVSGFYANPNADPACADRPAASPNAMVDRLEKLEGNPEQKAEKAIAMLKHLGEKEIRDIVSELKLRWNIGYRVVDRAFLSWEEVREMGAGGLISFGSHTVTHHILTGLPGKRVMEELLLSKEKLISEGAADPSFVPFCYPNGNHDEKIAEMVKEAGYHAAVTTMPGWNGRKSCRFTLRRVAIHQDMTRTKEMFACRIAGIL